MSYNGWSNYETWKFNLEVLDGWDRDDLFTAIGYVEGFDEIPTICDLEEKLQAWFGDFIDAMEGEPLLKEWASIAFGEVSFTEIGEHLLLDAQDSEFFSKAPEEFRCRDCGLKFNCGEEQPEEDMTSDSDTALCKWCGGDEGYQD
jgi:hypothetical protein